MFYQVLKQQKTYNDKICSWLDNKTFLQKAISTAPTQPDNKMVHYSIKKWKIYNMKIKTSF